MGPRAGLDAVVKREIPSPYRESNPPSSNKIKIVTIHIDSTVCK